jgi:hypothetical protein
VLDSGAFLLAGEGGLWGMQDKDRASVCMRETQRGSHRVCRLHENTVLL